MISQKLSIIIPVYNLEEYLSNCLDSILNQDFKDYELLLINDGSTDTSGEICNHYASKDKRIQVSHQKNAGVSVARNLGLEKARGEWICFVDGDDLLAENSLEKLIDQAGKNDPEILIAKSFAFADGKKTKEKHPFNNSFLQKTYGGYDLIVKKSYKRGSVCGCLFKNEYLEQNNLKFPLGLWNAEDSIFMSLNHLFVKKLQFIDLPFYLVNEREGSASRSWTFERVFRMTRNLTFINQYLKDNPNLSKEQQAILDYSKYGVVSAIFNNLYYCYSLKNFKKLLKVVRNELKGKLNIGNIPISTSKIKILNFSLSIFSLTVLINQRLRDLI